MEIRKIESPTPFYRPQTKFAKVMFLHVSVILSGGGGAAIPACIAGGIPALQQVSRGVSQHALQVSRPTPRGKVEGDLAGGVSRPKTKGEVEGDLAGGVSRPTPNGEVAGDLARGVSRPTPGGACSQGVCSQRGCLLQGCVKTPPP